MQPKYLNNQPWAEITREERYFCAELYQLIQLYGVKEFIGLLNSEIKYLYKRLDSLELDVKAEWQVGYEVCFYRDVFHNHLKSEVNGPSEEVKSKKNKSKRAKFKELFGIAESDYKAYLKRTFDLCLMSEEELVIIEAKAHQGLDNKQIASMHDDVKNLKKYIEKEMKIEEAKVLLVGLVSSNYNPKKDTLGNFDLVITWESLLAAFPKYPLKYKLNISSSLAALKRANATFEIKN